MQSIEIGIHNGHIIKIYSSILVFILSVLLFIPQFIEIEPFLSFDVVNYDRSSSWSFHKI